MIETIGLVLDGYALPAVDLRLASGRIYGLYDTGDGSASALLETLAGVRKTKRGQVKIGGFDTVTEAESAKRSVGFYSSKTSFYARETVWELLTFLCDLRSDGGNRAEHELHELLEEADLDNIKDKLLCKMTPEQVHRVGLMQTLIGGTTTIFLDNPTKGLAVGEAVALRNDIRKISAKGITVFIASDSSAELFDLCNAFLFLDGTGISQPLTQDNLTVENQTPAVKVFLGLQDKNINNNTKETEADE